MKGLSFFKVFLLHRSSEKMCIPLAFSARINGEFPEQALLRNHRGNVFRMKITNNGNKFYFSNGWAKFVEKNNVQDGDFLVFDYDGTYTFDVKIYGNTTCEKMVPKYEKSEESEESEKSEKSEESEIKESSDESDESYAESMEYEVGTEEEKLFDFGNMKKGKEKMVKSAKEPQIKKEKGKSVKRVQRLQMVVVSSHGDYKEKCAAETEEESSDEDEDEVFKYGIITRPYTPYFVTRLKKKRPNKLYIPLDVIRDHNLEIPAKMIILDDRKKEWKSDVKVWGDGRTWLTNGWKAFKRWNVLTYQDRCLCEFVQESGPRGLFLKIRILREGSWVPKKDN